MTTFSQRSWGALVLAADPDFFLESNHPIVYEFARGRHRRDPGAGGGAYANNAVVQQGYVTEAGDATFVDEDGDEVFVSEVKG